jgi:hypothetical protein
MAGGHAPAVVKREALAWHQLAPLLQSELGFVALAFPLCDHKGQASMLLKKCDQGHVQTTVK